MNAKNGMLCWNPGTSEVIVVPWPDVDRKSKKYKMSCLACYSEVRAMSEERRKAMVFIEAVHLMVRDKCDPMAVHQAMLSLDEYIDGCSHDMPGIDR